MSQTAIQPRKKRPKLGELIADDLRRMIIDGTLKEDSRLASEDDLAEEFGVSRPTMRESIRILESDGLLQPSPTTYGALVVKRPAPSLAVRSLGLLFQSEKITISDVYLARDIIEPACAKIAAEKSPEAAADALEAIVRHRREEAKSWEEEIADTVLFHETIAEYGGSRTLTLLLKIFNNIFELYIRRVRAFRKPDRDEEIRQFILADQEKLIALVRDGKGLAAEAHWRAHLAEVKGRYLRLDEFDQVIDVLNP